MANGLSAPRPNISRPLAITPEEVLKTADPWRALAHNWRATAIRDPQLVESITRGTQEVWAGQNGTKTRWQ